MKTIVSLIGLFFAVIIFGTIIGFSMTFLFIYTTNLVVGMGGEGISKSLALTLLFLWGGASTIATGPFIVIYSIRYPQNGIVRIITYTVLTVISWLVIIPLCTSFADKFAPVGISKPKEPLLSTHYFRPENGTLYYYTSINNLTKTVKGVSFELNDISSVNDDSVLLDNAPIVKSDIEPFSDVLIYDTLSVSTFVDVVLPVLYYHMEVARNALKDGVLSWFAFASWGLALYSLIGLRRLFHWRLLNFCGIFLACMGICVLNFAYSWGWDGTLFNTITLSNWILNCIIAAVLSCIGILLAIFRPDPNMGYVE